MILNANPDIEPKSSHPGDPDEFEYMHIHRYTNYFRLQKENLKIKKKIIIENLHVDEQFNPYNSQEAFLTFLS